MNDGTGTELNGLAERLGEEHGEPAAVLRAAAEAIADGRYLECVVMQAAGANDRNAGGAALDDAEELTRYAKWLVADGLGLAEPPGRRSLDRAIEAWAARNGAVAHELRSLAGRIEDGAADGAATTRQRTNHRERIRTCPLPSRKSSAIRTTESTAY